MSTSPRTLAQAQILLASACCRIVVGNFVDTASREMCLSANIILSKSVDLCLRPVVEVLHTTDKRRVENH